MKKKLLFFAGGGLCLVFVLTFFAACSRHGPEEGPKITIRSPIGVVNVRVQDVTGTTDEPNLPVEMEAPYQGTAVSDDSGNFTIAGVQFNEGINEYQVSATNIEGKSTASGVVTVDSAAPAVSISSPTYGVEIRGTTRCVVTGTVDDADPSSGIEIILVNGLEAELGSPDTTGGQWSATWTADVILPEGVNTIIAQASDEAGNEGVSDPIPVTVFVDGITDNDPPVVVITDPSESPYAITNSSTYVVKGLVFDKISGVSQVLVNGVNATLSLPDWEATVNLPSEGTNVVTASAEDNEGNGPSTDTALIFRDQTDPRVRITYPLTGQIVSAASLVTITGTVFDFAPSSGVDKVTVNDREVTFSNIDTTGGGWTADWSVTLRSPGSGT
ncbi:MAG: hypothetical protein JSU92_03445, partial [Deltaproteobacteria bacterium]